MRAGIKQYALGAGILVSSLYGLGEESRIAPILHVESFNKFAIGGSKASPTESYGYMLGSFGVKSSLPLGANNTYNTLKIGLSGAGAGLAYDSTKKDSTTNGGLGFNYVGYNQGYDGRGSASNDNTRNYYVNNAYINYAYNNHDKLKVYDLMVGRFYYDDGAYINSYSEGGRLQITNALGGDQSAGTHALVAEFAGISSTALLGDGFFWDYTRVYTPKGLLSAKLGYMHDWGERPERLAIRAFYYYGIGEYSAPGIDVEFAHDDTKSKGFASITKLNAVFPIYDRLDMRVPVLLGGMLSNPNGKEEGFTSTILLRQDFHFKPTERSSYELALAMQKNIGFSHARLGLFGSPLGVNIWDNSVYASGPSLNGLVYKDALSVLLFTKASFNFPTNRELPFGINSLGGIDVGLDGRYTTAPAADEYSLKLTADVHIAEIWTLSLIANYYTSIYRQNADGLFNSSAPSMPQNLAPGTAINRSYVMTKILMKF